METAEWIQLRIVITKYREAENNTREAFEASHMASSDQQKSAAGQGRGARGSRAPFPLCG